VPHLRCRGEGQGRDEPHPEHLDPGHDEEDELLRDAVGDHAREQRRQQDAHGGGRRHQRQLRRTSADADHLPHEGDEPDAGGEGREDQRDGEPAVARRAEGCEGAGQRASLPLVDERVGDVLGQRVTHEGPFASPHCERRRRQGHVVPRLPTFFDRFALRWALTGASGA
jgi:hypothetical protein